MLNVVSAEAVSEGKSLPLKFLASSMIFVVTVRLMVPDQLASGVSVRLDKAAKSASLENVQVPSPLSVPALSVAPDGTPETTTEVMLSDVSPAAVSPVAVVMFKSIAVSSSTVVLDVEATTVGVSASGLTITVPVVDAVAEAVPSTAVAEIFRLNSPE